MKNKSIFILTGLVFILIFSLNGQGAPQNWKAKALWESKEKIQRVIVADIDPKHKGDEIISLASNGEVVYTYESSGRGQLKHYGLIQTVPTASPVETFSPLLPGRNVW